MVRDAANGSSIRSCLHAGARERARRARHAHDRSLGNAEPDLAGVPAHGRRRRASRRARRSLRMGQVPLAPVARRHGGHDAAGRGVSLPAHRQLSSSAPTTRRACSTSSSMPSTSSSSASARGASAGRTAARRRPSRKRWARRARCKALRARPAARTSSSTSITGRRCCVGLRLRGLPQGLPQRHPTGEGGRAADPSRPTCRARSPPACTRS